MRKFFFVAVDDEATTAQRDAFTAYLLESHPGVGFWHNIAHMWMVVDPYGRITAAQLRDWLKTAMPGVNTMVVQALPRDWAGLAPTSSHQWLSDNLPGRLWP